MTRSVCTLIPIILLCMLCTTVWGHPDDPKMLDRTPRFEGPGYRAGAGAPAFASSGVQLYSWLTLADFGAHSTGNDCWGYTSPSGREYALMGLAGGTGFVEITNPGSPVILTVIAGPNSLWRDVKVYDHYAYVVSEGGGGIQVVDMDDIDNGNVTLVGAVTTPGTTATHNVVINESSGFLYRVGGSGEGVRIYDLNSNPAVPAFVTSWDDRYVHDAQVVTYTSGPNAGKEIAFLCSGFNGGFDQTGIDILDVTNKANILDLSRYEYPNAEYSHQAWLTPDFQYLILNDELDEGNLGIDTDSKVLDVSNLASPFEADTFTNGNPAIGHNLYILPDSTLLEANYTSGLRVFDASNPLNVVETGFFDTRPEDDATSFNGLWSVYPFFPSGTVIGSDLERGLFVWRLGEAPLAISFPDGLPNLIAPTGESVRVRIEEQNGGMVMPGTPTLHYDTGSGFTSVALTPTGGDLYDAVFPAIPCTTPVDWYVSAQDTGGLFVSSPDAAPTGGTHQSTSAVGEVVLVNDTLETNSGWTSGAAGDDATTGIWERVNPVGTAAQPEDDHTDPGGTVAWVTGQGLVGGGLGDNDVDGGSTTLLTPIHDLSGLNDPLISYWRWYSNTTGGSPGADTLVIDISDNGGSTWTNVEIVGPTGAGTSGGWNNHSFRVLDFVNLTANVRLRFIASDLGGGSIVEAAIDDFQVIEYDCAPPGDSPDLSIENIQVDYDPSDGDIDAGPGNLGQAVNVIVTVRNLGNVPVLSAEINADANVAGGSTISTSATVNDFGAGAGNQPLAPGGQADVVLSYGAGALDRCGTYSLVASHTPSNLESQGGGGSIFGDDDNVNDQITDHPDDLSDPDDSFSPDLLELLFGSIDSTVLASSVIIEDPSTEKIKVTVDFTGLGPGMDAHDVRLLADLTDLAGNPVYLSVFSLARNNVRSSGMRVARIKIDVSGLFPPPAPGTTFRVRTRLRDLNSSETCITSLTTNTTTLQ